MCVEFLEQGEEAMPKCEHGLASKECYVCASPKHAEQAEKQEPVAVVNSTISGHIDWLCVVFPKQGTKLYTTPQPQQEPVDCFWKREGYKQCSKREWVGLTDDEMLMIYGQQHEGKKYSLGRMVEQALKEKNSAT
jgi:hypothetical protein